MGGFGKCTSTIIHYTTLRYNVHITFSCNINILTLTDIAHLQVSWFDSSFNNDYDLSTHTRAL